jgi:hypothetical protein
LHFFVRIATKYAGAPASGCAVQPAQFPEQVEAAMARGWGTRDVTSMFAFQEEITGVKVRPPPPGGR